MRLMSHIRKHPTTGIFWYRRVVPPLLRGHMPPVPGFDDKPDRTEFSKTLRTRDKGEANRAAALIDRADDTALTQAERSIQPSRECEGTLPARARSRPIRPQEAFAALERWRSHEIAEAKQRIFNGDKAQSYWERAADHRDGRYILQQFGSSPRSRPDGWQALPGFDDILVRALSEQGLSIELGHPALEWLRPSFATGWYELLRATDLMRKGLWAWDETPPVRTGSSPTSTAGASTLFLARLEAWRTVLPMKERQRDSMPPM